jgi:integrase
MRLRYVQAWVDREGKAHHYFRRTGHPRVRLPGLPGSAEFMRAYEAALEAAPAEIGAGRSRPGSVGAAIAGYYTSLEYGSLATATKAARRSVLERFRDAYGDFPLANMPQRFLVTFPDGMKPHAARNWLKAIRGLMTFAVSRQMMAADPSLGIKLPKVKTDGHHSWEEHEIELYQATHPIGSKARLAFALGLYTAQRRSDVIRLGPNNLRDGHIEVRQRKTGTFVAIPILPELQAILDATPCEHPTLIVNSIGRPYSPSDFSEWFRRQCDAADLPRECVFHGLRKAALTRLANSGATTHEIASISGHKSLKEIERYTKAASQRQLAHNAIGKLTSTKRESKVSNRAKLTLVSR